MKGSYREGRVEYLRMAIQAVVLEGGSVEDDEWSFLDDQSIELSALKLREQIAAGINAL